MESLPTLTSFTFFADFILAEAGCSAIFRLADKSVGVIVLWWWALRSLQSLYAHVLLRTAGGFRSGVSRLIVAFTFALTLGLVGTLVGGGRVQFRGRSPSLLAAGRSSIVTGLLAGSWVVGARGLVVVLA